jgi:hypothetical protein
VWLSNSARRGVGHCCTKSASHPPPAMSSRDLPSPLKYTASALEVPTNALAPDVSPPRTECPVAAPRSSARSAVMACRPYRAAERPCGLPVNPCACGTANAHAASCAHARAPGVPGSPRRHRSRSIAPWADAKRPRAGRSAAMRCVCGRSPGFARQAGASDGALRN